MNRDEVAEKVFGDVYTRLSAWGQRTVDNILTAQTLTREPYTSSLQDLSAADRMARDNEHLATQLESARLENLELWDENTELKAQLAELRAQFNLPNDSTL